MKTLKNLKKISSVSPDDYDVICTECGATWGGCDRSGGDCLGAIMGDHNKIISPIVGMYFRVDPDGKIIPVIMFDGAELGTLVCNELSLPSTRYVLDNNLFPGKLVGLELSKQNTVKVVPKNNVPFVPVINIKRCSFCDTKLIYKEDGLYCPNVETCSGAAQTRLLRFFGYRGLNVDGIGDKIIRQWVKKKLYMPSQVCLYLLRSPRYKKQQASLEVKLGHPAQQILYSVGVTNTKAKPNKKQIRELEALKKLGFMSLNKLKYIR